MSGANPTLPLDRPPGEAAAVAARAAAIAARASAAADTAFHLAELASQERAALAEGRPTLTLPAAPRGAPRVTAPASVAVPAVTAVAIGLGFFVEAGLAEAAELAAERARALGAGGGG